jgi:hypothetical protein
MFITEKLRIIPVTSPVLEIDRKPACQSISLFLMTKHCTARIITAMNRTFRNPRQKTVKIPDAAARTGRTRNQNSIKTGYPPGRMVPIITEQRE